MTQSAMTWHPADIRAAVAKRGSTLTEVSRAAGLAPGTCSDALRAPCYAAEQAIAAFLGIPAHSIWPGRYDATGLPLHPRIRKQLNARNAVIESQKRAAA